MSLLETYIATLVLICNYPLSASTHRTYTNEELLVLLGWDGCLDGGKTLNFSLLTQSCIGLYLYSNHRERRLQFIDSNTIMMWNERETITFVSSGAGEFFFNNDMITVTSYGMVII